MKNKENVFFRSIQPLIGSVIGVGIFGLPFVFAQAGFFIGLVHLLVVGLVSILILVMYGEIVMHTKGKSRFTGIVRKYLGEHWSWIATVLMIGTTWGALIAYIIIGGQFLFNLVGGVFGSEVFVYQMIFYAVSSFLMIGGLNFVSKLEMYFVVALIAMLFLVITGSLPYIDITNLVTVNLDSWFLPFGVVLFAFGGMAAIPEMADILGKEKRYLNRAILTGISVVAIVYFLFTLVVVATTGDGTSQESIIGLGDYVGNWVLVVGSFVGLFAVFTSYLILGMSILDTFVFDFKKRFLSSWLVTVLIPLFVFLLGARDFIDVISFSGGIFNGFVGLLVVYMYWKMKNSHAIPKRSLRVPKFVLLLCALFFMFGVVVTIFTI